MPEDVIKVNFPVWCSYNSGWDV